ncbi:MAG: hypothetical protein HDKAJFGB_02434 [Anaerolineae bacterium]|nr:hypothetical protein [Anaerolineae bacterium]
MKKMTAKFFLGALIVALGILVALFLFEKSNIGSAQSSILGEDIAVRRALNYAQDDGSFGGLTETPNEIYGQVMSYEQAWAIITGQPFPTDAPRPKDADKKVWLIVFQGSGTARPGVDPDPKARQTSTITQMVEMIDAETGEAIAERSFGGPSGVDVKNLAKLTLPQRFEMPLPTLPIKTVAPLPTWEPVPTEGP